ncbi:MAG: ATP-dependent sacrificial sulfur transferase LarE [Verrucomicrobiota bacterium]|nr:ATP-dependent sacrificial sulfur transferase LarE [Verrucomicrobiota bacterium]
MINNIENRLKDFLKSYSSIVVAFSGGMDSMLLGAVINDMPETKLLAVHIASVFTPAAETADAVAWAEKFNVELIILNVDILSNSDVKKNPLNRCYYCKYNLMSQILKIASKRGFSVVVDGTNVDDFGDFRPGLKATEELGIIHPLAEVGFSKQDIYELGEKYNLDFKFSSACLASRIPYGTVLCSEELGKVERTEELMKSMGFKGHRVRNLGNTANIEVRSNQFDLLLTKRLELIEILQENGFQKIYLDLQGYRTGSLNP